MATRNTVNLSHLSVCVDDVRKAARKTAQGPRNDENHARLMKRLGKAREALPPLYRNSVADPFMAKLDALGESGLASILARDPAHERAAGMLFDITQALLQNGEHYEQPATDAFQEVISDIYDGFLSAEDRSGIRPPDDSMIAPLVKWGDPALGPYTWPAEATRAYAIQTAIVSMPPAHARSGLLAWSTLGHETAGHDILSANDGLLQELQARVRQALIQAKFGEHLAHYWSVRIDETASDVMGVLNMGPAAAIGLIGYLRGLNAANGGAANGAGPHLWSEGPEDEVHPADVLRGELGAGVAELLPFGQGREWAEAIRAEVDADIAHNGGGIVLAGETFKPSAARRSARTVAALIANQKWDTLDGHAFSEIQTWRDSDEAITQELRAVLASSKALPQRFASDHYAAHALSAAVIGSIAGDAPLTRIFDRAIAVLNIMHAHNASWGPLLVRHPSDVHRHFVYPPRSKGV